VLTRSQQAAKKPDHFGGVFAIEDDPKKKPDKEEEKKVKAVLERLRYYGVDTIVEVNVQYALRAPSAHGDPDNAFRLLMLLQDTYEGIVRPYHPDTKLVGAVNREGVTCYMDALLFAMFARLDSFEAMLYDNFQDVPRKRLAGLLRLWVNMLRTGRLITTDITWHLQAALAECGWEDAARLEQQDPSEAFTFITGQLGLPLLTLKMDLFHTGKEDPQDDHKFVNERLLEVAIPDEPLEGESAITLEVCLEQYFNNRIEVKRHLEMQRRNTLKSVRSADSISKVGIKPEPGLHVEVVDVTSRPGTPLVQTPIAETPTLAESAAEKLRPTAGRKRADSIFSQRKVKMELTGADHSTTAPDDPDAVQHNRTRKMSTRTEVLMPAWQFFKLLPWYTDHLPTSDAQVAAHFSNKRPVLGICLKRYSYTMDGRSTKRDTYVDIPLEIGVPDFLSDDDMEEHGSVVGNFRLMLQSVVCHRGESVNSGHYVTLCRGKAGNAQQGARQTEGRGSSPDGSEFEGSWMRFDDLARERVSYVDIHDALKEETPYLLFYQVQPIDDDGHSIHELPSYAEATSRSLPDATVLEKSNPDERSRSDHALTNALSNLPSNEQARSEVADFAAGSTRTSLDASTTLESPRGRLSIAGIEERRRSIAFDESSFSGASIRTEPSSVPTTPSEDKSGGFFSMANKIGTRRGSRPTKANGASRSRPTSTGPQGDNTNSGRFSLNMTKLTQRMSRGEMPVVQPSDAVAAELAGQWDAEKTPAVAAVVLPHSESKESVTTAAPASKTKKDKTAVREKKKHHHHRGMQEDRDCAIM